MLALKDCPYLIISGVLLNCLLFNVCVVLLLVPFLREKECGVLYCMYYYVMLCKLYTVLRMCRIIRLF